MLKLETTIFVLIILLVNLKTQIKSTVTDHCIPFTLEAIKKSGNDVVMHVEPCEVLTGWWEYKL